MKGVRLPENDVKIIKESFIRHFHRNDQLWIFGSRANLDKRGGDIDLYIETHESLDLAYEKRGKFWIELQDLLGEQKIDIVLNIISLEGDPLPIYDVAKNEGIKLV